MISRHQRACVKLRFINLQNSNADLWIFFLLPRLMRLLMLKTWSVLSKVGKSSCPLSFPRGVHFQHKLSRPARLFCCRIPFLIIPDNYKYVRRVTVWRPLTPARWRAVRLKWHGDISHPLPLSISSRCSRLMELLIGENSSFLDARFPCRWDVWGVDPVLICCCRKASYSYVCFPLWRST